MILPIFTWQWSIKNSCIFYVLAILIIFSHFYAVKANKVIAMIDYELIVALILNFRFRRLRTPANIFIMNLAVADLGACCLHSLAAYSNFNGRWSFGRIGCQLYGLSVGLFGLISILTLSAIAVERCLVITSTPLGISGFKITRGRAQKVFFFICG